MTKFKVIGAICLAVSLAAASPSFAAGMRGGHMGGGHFHGGGFRGGVGPGVAAGLIAGSVISVIGGAAYGYYGAPNYDYGDSYGYYDSDGWDGRSTNSMNPGSTAY